MHKTESGVLAFTLFLFLFLSGEINLTSAAQSDCYKLSADIVFALDSSYSIRPDDYQRQLSFLKALIDKFTIGQNHIQIGVVSFASTVRPDVRLNEFDNNRDLKVAIGRIRQLNGGTDTQDAIHFIHAVMYESLNGGRPWAKKQMVLITDGLSSNSTATLLEASIARSKGVEVFSVLVGDGVKDLEIRGVASDPKDQHVFRVEDYKALTGIEKALSSAACQRPISDHNGTDTEAADRPTVPPATACERSAADVIFLMDSSSSIWEPDFRAQIRFIQKVISSFDISKAATRVGVVAYSDAPITLFDLSDKQTHENIHKALSNAPYITGGTNTALAIRHARKQFVSNENVRHNAAQIIIILSDGQSNNLKETIDEASHAHAENVYIFAIGIGDKTEALELMALASDPDDQFVFHVDDYEALAEINELLAVKTCDVSLSMAQNDQAYAACPSEPTDVLFVYDTTSLTRHHHDYVIGVITEVTDTNRLNSEHLQVGVLREPTKDSISVLHDIELTNRWTQSDFKTQLDPDSRTASIDTLFRRARHNYFHPTIQLDHISHRRTIVLFLDSLLKNSYGATIEAIRLRRSHVSIVVVTLGKQTNRMEVIGLASAPHDVYVIDTPNVIDLPVEKVVSKLLAVLCRSDQSQ